MQSSHSQDSPKSLSHAIVTALLLAVYDDMFGPNIDLTTLISTKCLPCNVRAMIGVF